MGVRESCYVDGLRDALYHTAKFKMDLKLPPKCNMIVGPIKRDVVIWN